MIVIDQTEALAFTALRAFLLEVLPTGTPVLRSQANRVAEPMVNDFCLMTPLLRTRLATNWDRSTDCAFTGSISGMIMSVSAVEYGVILVGAPVYGVGVAVGTNVVEDLGGGLYSVRPAQNVVPGPMFAGTTAVQQSTQVDVQVDLHGPAGADNAQRVGTLWRDEFGCAFLSRLGAPCQPLYAGDPRQMPFINAEQQFEFRWLVDLSMQVNPTLTYPQEFADQLAVTVLNADATYSP